MSAGTNRQGRTRSVAASVAFVAAIWAVDAAAGDRAASARAVLDTHCARCHEAAKLENPPAKGGLGNILDLDALSAREDLVAPADPDASRIYQVMLAQHRPLPVFFGPVPGPSAAEIATVRDWLQSLPPRKRDCADKEPVTREDLMRDIAAWRQAFETDAAQPLRFISLANLHNHCLSDARLAAYRGAVQTLMARLTLRPVSLDTVGDASVLLAFRPSDFGLTAEAWDLRAGPDEELPGVATAESLAARALAAAVDPAESGAVTRAHAAPNASGLIDGIDPVDALALEHTRPVSAERAAVEMGVSADDLRRRVHSLDGDDATLALRLFQTALPRAEWDTLKARLTGRARTGASTPPAPIDRKLSLSLWTNALSYKAGDLLTVYARPSGDCNLTILAVEAGGLATVLFPNDAATDNRIRGGTRVQVPPPTAPFQLRLDKPGRHGLVAICNANARRPQGIGHDFERQRFTVLGDWSTFLREAAVREAEYQKTQDDLRRFRTGAGGAATLEEQLPLGTEDEARAALTLEVGP